MKCFGGDSRDVMDNAANSRQFRLGVVGCGRVFERYHLPALKRSSDWRFVSACESLKERREWVQSQFQGLFTTQDYSAFLEKSTLDAVLIATPPETHCQLALQALEMGLHVLVEKPMALNCSEALLMLETSLRVQKQLWVGFTRRFRRPYIELKKRLSLVPKDSIQAIHFKLITDSENWKSVTLFLGDDSKGGGILEDVASHQVDLIPWLFGQRAKEVKAEFSAENTISYVKYKLKLENNLIASCEAGHGSIYSENLEIQLKDRKLVVHPSGFLETQWIPVSCIRYYYQLKMGPHLIFHKLAQKPNLTLESFEKQFSFFAAAIRDKKESFLGADARSGIDSLRAIKACRESLQSCGQWKLLKGKKT